MNNLHSAFFDVERDSYRQDTRDEIIDPIDPMERERLDEIEAVGQETRENLDSLTDEIGKPDFSKISEAIVKDKRKTENFKEIKERFDNRLKSTDSQGRKYSDVWNEKIKEGFKELITSLEGEHFFDGCENKVQKTKKIKEVELKYRNQVKAEYTKNIWEASDDEFDKIKDTIFDIDSEASPQRKTFYSLINKNHGTVEEVTIWSNGVEKIGDDNVETVSEKAQKQIKFLAHDLPNYLWEIKDPNLFQKLFANVDAPSETDRAEITKFIKVVDKLDGEDVEVKLINIFRNLQKGAGKEEIKQQLEENDISFKNKNNDKQNDRYLARIKKVFDFYKDTMNPNNSLKDQHAIYIDILTRVKVEGGFDKVMMAYGPKVEAYQNRKKLEGKKYEKGTNLGEEERQQLKAFADALNIPVSTTDKKVKKTSSDYTSLTRLSEKSDEYFRDTDLVDILADLNNDGEITHADRGTTKTGTQFKELYNFLKNEDGVGEDIILSNMLEQAKLKNKILPPEVQIPDEEFTAEEIKAGNKKLIFLLQNIISMPGQDLYTLMLYGPDALARQGEIYDSLKDMPESAEDERVQNAAAELLRKKGITPDSNIDIENVNYDGLRQAVAGAMYVAYFNNNGEITTSTAGQDVDSNGARYVQGVGLGGRISFDEWVKGLSLNIGVQGIRDQETGKLSGGLGLVLSYNPEIAVGNGVSVTPGVHCGFIMLGTIPAFDVGASIGVAKAWVDKHHVLEKVGFQTGVDYIVTANTLVFSAIGSWNRDKAAGIEQSKDKMKEAFNKEIMTPLLDKIAEEFGEDEFDLTQDNNIARVNKAIDEMINKVLGDKKSEFKKEDIRKLKENTVSLLINYNKAPINNSNVRKHIAEEMSESYASVWVEQGLDAIVDKTYLSGLRAGVSFVWFVGSVYFAPVLHLGVSFKKHRNDGYGDGSYKEYEFTAIDGDTRDQTMVNHANKYLDKDAQFSLKEVDGENYVVISQKMMDKYDIFFNPEMKGLMKKDASGDILLSEKTFINLPVRKYGAATKYTYILVGGGDVGKAVRHIDDTWFTDGPIDVDKLPSREVVFTQAFLDQILENLQSKPEVAGDDVIKNFKFDDTILPQLKKGKKYKITLEKDGNSIKTPIVEEVKEGDPLQIEYICDEKVELMDSKAKDIADAAYLEARKVESNALYSISHGKSKWSSYVKFANEMREKKYVDAKKTIVEMLPRMDKFINKYQRKDNQVEFANVIPQLDALDNDEVALGQALLSINNVFARVSSVQGGKEKDIYHFKKYEGGKMVDRPMGEIIERRAVEIERKINKSNLSQDVKDSYTSLIGAMEKYRKEHPDYYNVKAKERETFNNAVGINLGNAINIENPLFNPELYKDSQIELKDLPDFQGKDTLQKHAMEVMAKDKSLMGPILEKLGVNVPEGSNEISYEFVNYNPEDGELTIDIAGKRVKFKANMKVGYFSQCVNHMILLDNIEAEVEGQGAHVQWGPGVMGDGKIIEGTKRTIVASSSADIDISLGLGKFGQQDATTHQGGGTSSGNGNGGTGQGGSTGGGSGEGGGNSGSGGGGRD